MRDETGNTGGDDPATLTALGVIAYCLETMLHEGLGHGGVCLAQGHHIILLTPLWMRCDVVTAVMVFAGPAANLAAAVLSYGLLRSGRIAGQRSRMFIWLSLAFNGLVATGYPVVGGATGFGDWPFLFQSVHPAWAWRAGLVVIGMCLYVLVLRATVSRYVAFAGGGRSTFVHRAVFAAFGAGMVAVGAQAYGQSASWSALILPAACTLGVGASLLGMRDKVAPSAGGERVIARSRIVILMGTVVAVTYVFAIGPGLRLHV